MFAAAGDVYGELWPKIPVFSCEEGFLQRQAGETAEPKVQPAHWHAGENPDLYYGESRVNWVFSAMWEMFNCAACLNPGNLFWKQTLTLELLWLLLHWAELPRVEEGNDLSLGPQVLKAFVWPTDWPFMLLSLILQNQVWARGFQGMVDVSEVKEVYIELLKKGVEFPSSDTSSGGSKVRTLQKWDVLIL